MSKHLQDRHIPLHISLLINRFLQDLSLIE